MSQRLVSSVIGTHHLWVIIKGNSIGVCFWSPLDSPGYELKIGLLMNGIEVLLGGLWVLEEVPSANRICIFHYRSYFLGK